MKEMKVKRGTARAKRRMEAGISKQVPNILKPKKPA
jgi:hypothetical protein